MEVEIEAVEVMYVVSPNGPQGAAEAFKKLEGAIDWQLRGRRFYGTILNDGEYRACLATIEGESPEKLGLKKWTIPGGKYFKEKIADWEKRVSEIAPKFEEILKKVNFRRENKD